MPSPQAARPAFTSCSETTYLYAASEIEIVSGDSFMRNATELVPLNLEMKPSIEQACIICFDSTTGFGVAG